MVVGVWFEDQDGCGFGSHLPLVRGEPPPRYGGPRLGQDWNWILDAPSQNAVAETRESRVKIYLLFFVETTHHDRDITRLLVPPNIHKRAGGGFHQVQGVYGHGAR